MRKSGAAKAAKKAGNVAAEGAIIIKEENGVAVLLEVNCQTDFVAKDASFTAFAEEVAAGTIPKDQADNLVIVCGVFIHWEAEDDKKIYEYNKEATRLSIQRAMKNEPTADEMIAKKDDASHPFYAG